MCYYYFFLKQTPDFAASLITHTLSLRDRVPRLLPATSPSLALHPGD